MEDFVVEVVMGSGNRIAEVEGELVAGKNLVCSADFLYIYVFHSHRSIEKI